ncbi:hypothetical protein SORDD17_01611 [Streptococcus oralis]|uniref:Uncharacterized protein n=1 Tax=Streptococcus oralis TaxID=1303 RepID=A0A139RGS0_STROR|nr:hypothetical protein [Streptococcus oralis]KXU13888.1 hypothetical protein SORDD17_01611 [Streptococcus oralis]
MNVENRLLDKADWYYENALTNYLHSYQLQKEELNPKRLSGDLSLGCESYRFFCYLAHPA